MSSSSARGRPASPARVRWRGEKAEALGVNLFTGFPAASLLTQGARVAGVRTAEAGLDREGGRLATHQPANDLVAQVTVLAEGTRGMLGQAYLEWQQVAGENPQIFALGVKEIWETKRPLDTIVHTLGWPLPHDAFGGSFMYPLEPRLVALGLVVGLDYHDATLDVHALLQQMKLHPLFRQRLEGGEMVEWGAKTIPEGGYYSIPARRSGDGDRKSTRLNSSHLVISYAVFCLKKKTPTAILLRPVAAPATHVPTLGSPVVSELHALLPRLLPTPVEELLTQALLCAATR